MKEPPPPQYTSLQFLFCSCVPFPVLAQDLPQFAPLTLYSPGSTTPVLNRLILTWNARLWGWMTRPIDTTHRRELERLDIWRITYHGMHGELVISWAATWSGSLTYVLRYLQCALCTKKESHEQENDSSRFTQYMSDQCIKWFLSHASLFIILKSGTDRGLLKSPQIIKANSWKMYIVY